MAIWGELRRHVQFSPLRPSSPRSQNAHAKIITNHLPLFSVYFSDLLLTHSSRAEYSAKVFGNSAGRRHTRMTSSKYDAGTQPRFRLRETEQRSCFVVEWLAWDHGKILRCHQVSSELVRHLLAPPEAPYISFRKIPSSKSSGFVGLSGLLPPW